LTCEIDVMFYDYVLRSLNDFGLYIGCTKDLKRRVNAHNTGQVESTKSRLPMKLIYYEACLDQKDAFHREKYLKTTYGRRYLKNRLKGYFTGLTMGYGRYHFLALLNKLANLMASKTIKEFNIFLIIE